jgi:hypothetical protein
VVPIGVEPTLTGFGGNADARDQEAAAIGGLLYFIRPSNAVVVENVPFLLIPVQNQPPGLPVKPGGELCAAAALALQRDRHFSKTMPQLVRLRFNPF